MRKRHDAYNIEHLLCVTHSSGNSEASWMDKIPIVV